MRFLWLCFLIMGCTLASRCQHWGEHELALSFIDAIKMGDLGLAKAYLKRDESAIYIVDQDKSTPLHWACASCNKNIDLVTWLLNKGVDVNAKDLDGWTPLFWAVYEKTPLFDTSIDIEVIELLINKNAQVNIQDKDGKTPLHYAVLREQIDVEVIKLLINKNAQVNIQDQTGKTPLDYVMENKPKCVAIIALLNAKQGVR